MYLPTKNISIDSPLLVLISAAPRRARVPPNNPSKEKKGLLLQRALKNSNTRSCRAKTTTAEQQ